MKRPDSIRDLSFDKEIIEGIQMAIAEETDRSLIVIKFADFPDSYLVFEKNAETSLKVDDFMVRIKLEYLHLKSFGSSHTVMTSDEASDVVLRWSHPQLDFL